MYVIPSENKTEAEQPLINWPSISTYMQLLTFVWVDESHVEVELPLNKFGEITSKKEKQTNEKDIIEAKANLSQPSFQNHSADEVCHLPPNTCYQKQVNTRANLVRSSSLKLHAGFSRTFSSFINCPTSIQHSLLRTFHKQIYLPSITQISKKPSSDGLYGSDVKCAKVIILVPRARAIAAEPRILG